MTRSESDPADRAERTWREVARQTALRLDDPVLRRLLEQVAIGALRPSDALVSTLEYVDRSRQGATNPSGVHRALSLADAALGAEGSAVSGVHIRELGRRVAEGRMTRDEAVFFMQALIESGARRTDVDTFTSILDERVGPFYDPAALITRLQGSSESLEARVRNGDVLVVLSADGFRLFPAFQFDEATQPLPRLRHVLAELDPTHIDSWGDAVWLNAPDDDLDGMSPAAALRIGRAEDVIRLARHAGSFRLG